MKNRRTNNKRRSEKALKSEERARLIRVLIFGMVYLTSSICLVWQQIPHSLNVKVNQTSPFTINAPRNIEVQTSNDRLKTDELRTEAARSVEKVYLMSYEVNKEIRAQITSFFEQVRRAQKDPDNVPIQWSLNLSTSGISTCLDTSFDMLSSLEFLTNRTADRILRDGVKAGEEARFSEKINILLEPVKLTRKYKLLVTEILQNTVRQNLFYNEQATLEKINQIKKEIFPLSTSLRQGQPVVYKGDTITADHLEILQSLGLMGGKLRIRVVVGLLALNLVILLLFDRLLFFLSPRIYLHNQAYVMFGLGAVVVLAMANILLSIPAISWLPYPVYLLPIGAFVIMQTVLVSPIIGLIFGMFCSLLVGVMLQFDFVLMLFLFFSSVIALLTVIQANTRNDLIKSGVIQMVSNLVLICIIGIVAGYREGSWFINNALVGCLNGFLSSVIALGLLPYFEGIFNIATTMKLIELSNLNHQLLRRLLLEAPGTYHHSLMVSNLSESACEAIGCNPHLGRVLGYFHDVGKIKRPSFFIENQTEGNNPHDNITPALSAIIITSHPKDGADLCREYGLPRVIVEGVEQHHGSGLVSYFYYRIIAEMKKEWEHDEEVKSQFSYPGPRPQSRETGILLLADSVEAAVRSLEKPSPNKIEAVIDKIFDEKVHSRQLDECNLSLNDLRVVKSSFTKIFAGMFHYRVDYAKDKEKLLKQATPTRDDDADHY